MLIFWIKEAIKLIGRAKSSFFLSLVSTSISVFLITASVMVIQLSDNLQTRLKESVSINIFLKDTVNGGDLLKIKKIISGQIFVKSVLYINKNQAADNFVKQTGEDFRKLLDYNPLPASFTVRIKSEYVERDSLNNIVNYFSGIEGVDEAGFQQEFVYKLLAYLSEIKKYIFGVTLILFMISLYILYSTVKLITNSKYEELETMKLVGAKLSTIKMPIILNGMLIGLFANIIAAGCFIFFIYYFDNFIGIHRVLHFRKDYYLAGLLLIGPVLGLFVSTFSLRKINLKI